jgi:hypothetical protein
MSQAKQEARLNAVALVRALRMRDPVGFTLTMRAIREEDTAHDSTAHLAMLAEALLDVLDERSFDGLADDVLLFEIQSAAE